MRRWKVRWGMLWIAVAAGCVSSHGDSQLDSETHFLRACEQTCYGGMECICGVCSVTCDLAKSCGDTHAGASCVSAGSFAGDACESEPSVCDVTCEEDADCADLSAEHHCRAGHCRAPESPTPSVTCEWEGEVYAEGDTWKWECNNCRCEANGSPACTVAACGCAVGTEFHAWGSTFIGEDGCNACTCGEEGVVCEDTCDTCDLAFEEGVSCDPQAVYWYDPERGSCEKRMYGGCEGNDNNFESLAECTAACGSTPGDAPTSCLVEGVVYPEGATVDDPFSCNSCFCDAGRLDGCSVVGCPAPCPADTVAASACAQCGAAGGCEVVETGCLPTCSSDDDCSDPHPFCDVAAGHCAGQMSCD